jgi:hypothetical protein
MQVMTLARDHGILQIHYNCTVFAAELPPDPSKTNRVIRPEGQGWFTMSKR